eukprot:Rmarinus@m.10173
MGWGPSGNTDSDVRSWAKRLEENDSKLTSLTLLRLRKFSDENVRSLAMAMARNTHLQEFYASGVTLSERTVEAFALSLSSNSGLRTLCLGCDCFGDALMGILSQGLSANTTLSQLDVSNKGLGIEGCRYLGDALPHSGLEELNIGRNKLTDAAMSALAFRYASDCPGGVEAGEGDCLPSGPTSKLRRLDLQQNEFGPEGLAAVAALTAASADMKELIISQNPHLTGEGLKNAILYLLGHTKSLECLKMEQCPAGDVGARALAAGLAQPHTVKRLYVSNCDFTHEGICEIARALQNSSVCTFHAGENYLGEEGMKSVAQLLEDTALEDLNFGQCGGAGSGVRAFFRSGFKSLRRLAVFGNDIGDNGALAIVEDLQREHRVLPNLELLDVGGNGITLSGVKAIFSALKNPDVLPSLRQLVVGGNTVDSMDAWAAEVAWFGKERPGIDVIWRAAKTEENP